MNETINNNIDLFVKLVKDGEKISFSVLITDNNQIINIGSFSKDTKTNIGKFIELYNSLNNPYIIMENVDNNMEVIFHAFKQYGFQNTKLFYNYLHHKTFFIDIDKNIFLKLNNKEIEEDEEFNLLKVFINYIYFSYNIDKKDVHDFLDININSLQINYNHKLDHIKHKAIDMLSGKIYYEDLIAFIEQNQPTKVSNKII